MRSIWQIITAPYYGALSVAAVIVSVYTLIAAALSSVLLCIVNISTRIWSTWLFIRTTVTRIAQSTLNVYLAGASVCNSIYTTISWVVSSMVCAVCAALATITSIYQLVMNQFYAAYSNILYAANAVRSFWHQSVEAIRNSAIFCQEIVHAVKSSPYLCVTYISQTFQKTVAFVRLYQNVWKLHACNLLEYLIRHKYTATSVGICCIAIGLPSAFLFADIWYGDLNSASDRVDRYSRIVQLFYKLIYRTAFEPVFEILCVTLSAVCHFFFDLTGDVGVFCADLLVRLFSVASLIIAAAFQFCYSWTLLLLSAYDRYVTTKELIFMGFCLLVLHFWFGSSEPRYAGQNSASPQEHYEAAIPFDDLLPDPPSIGGDHASILTPAESDAASDEELDEFLPNEQLY